MLSTPCAQQVCDDQYELPGQLRLVCFQLPDLAAPIAHGRRRTKFYSERAILAARDPRELFNVPGKTHIDLYDDLSKSGPKLLDFFGTHLKVPHVTLHLAVS